MNKYNVLQTVLSGFIAAVSAKLGILGPMLMALTCVMVVDYFTGMAVASKAHTISSKVGLWGIIKKLCYIVVVGIGMLIDWLILTTADSMGVHINVATFFGLLVAVWLIINELISILENLHKMDVPMPSFLIAVVQHFKVAIEDKGDEMANIGEQNSNNSTEGK